MKKYRFSYSSEHFEGIKDFSNARDLRKFINRIPPNELKNSVVMKTKNEVRYVGQYQIGKTGLLVKF
jgi:hypothetical protein